MLILFASVFSAMCCKASKCRQLVTLICESTQAYYLILQLRHRYVFFFFWNGKRSSQCVICCKQIYSLCQPGTLLHSADSCVLYSTWHDFLVYSRALIHSSSCMCSCDVSLCVGSLGAWREVHGGQNGSAVVMTIIILITVLHKKVTGFTWGCSFLVQQSLVFCFAWQVSCYFRA